MAFGMILCPFQQISLAMTLVQIHSLNLSSSLDHDLLQIQQVGPLHKNFPIYFLSKQFLPSILALGDLQRSYPFCFDFCPQTNFPSQSFEPSTNIHEDPLVFSSNFSNYTCCKFGTDLSNLVKFIQIFLQKFQVKSGSHQEH